MVVEKGSRDEYARRGDRRIDRLPMRGGSCSLFGALAFARPELTSTVILSTKASDDTRVNLCAFLCAGVVIKGQFGHRWDVIQGEESQIVKPLVSDCVSDGEHPAIRSAGVVHEASCTAEPLSIHDIDVCFINFGGEVKSKEIGMAIFQGDVFANICVFFGNNFS